MSDAPDVHPAPQPLASRRHTVRFLLIVAGIAAAAMWRSAAAPAAGAPQPVSRVPLYLSLLLLEAALVWYVAIGVRRQGHSVVELVGARWRSWRDALRDVALAVGMTLLLRGLSAALHWVAGPVHARTAFVLPRGTVESLLWVVVSLAAGVGEEAAFRGYLQPQLWALTKSLPLAIVAQALAFGVAHLYQGWRAALVTALYGLAFGLLAAWRRSIVPGILAHWLVDVIGGLVRR
jgi:membrane protease YdiL (CAAX protease family)